MDDTTNPTLRWLALGASALVLAGIAFFALNQGPDDPPPTSSATSPPDPTGKQRLETPPAHPDTKASSTKTPTTGKTTSPTPARTEKPQERRDDAKPTTTAAQEVDAGGAADTSSTAMKTVEGTPLPEGFGAKLLKTFTKASSSATMGCLMGFTKSGKSFKGDVVMRVQARWDKDELVFELQAVELRGTNAGPMNTFDPDTDACFQDGVDSIVVSEVAEFEGTLPRGERVDLELPYTMEVVGEQKQEPDETSP